MGARLSLITWLKKDKGYLELYAFNEIIHNEKQHKDFNVYHGLLTNSFQKMFEVLKPGKYSNRHFS